MSDITRSDLRRLSDDDLSELFGRVVQEIANRANDGDDGAAMYELARAFWESAQEDDE